MSISLQDYFDYTSRFESFQPPLIVGEVADVHDDPEKYPDQNNSELDKGRYLGRLKVKIPGATDELNPEDLPWTNQISPLGTGTADGFGHFKVPAAGTKVYLKKYGEDWWIVGEAPSEKKTAIQPYAEDYPDSHGSKDRSGNFTHINMKQGYAYFLHSSGSWLRAVASGTVNVHVEDDWNVDVVDNGTFKYGGFVKEDIAEHFESKVGDYAKIEIGDRMDIKVGADGTIDINGSMLLTVHSDGTIGVTGNLQIASGQTISMHAGNAVNINASKIKLNGDIELNGGDVDISGGKVNLDGKVYINGVKQRGD
jgi:hypothetical protein